MPSRYCIAGMPLICLAVLTGCISDLTSKLSGNNLSGTWRTALPVTFTYTSDFCGANENIGRASWNVTWQISAVRGNANLFDVTMTASQGAFQRFTTSCGSAGYVPFVTPFGFQLSTSSTALSASDPRNGLVVSGSYTTDLMMVTWRRSDCLLYCSGEYTASNGLKLVRQ